MMRLGYSRSLPAAAAILAAALAGAGQGKTAATAPAATAPATTRKAPPGHVALVFTLPRPRFAGTPKHIPPGTNVLKPTGKPRPPVFAPRGTVNIALKRPVTSSDPEPIIGELAMVTDGDKEAADGSFVELGPDKQWVQIDLGRRCRVHAVLVWHYHCDPRVYRDVIVQVADDKDFIKGVRTLFNADHDNSSGLGVGKDHEYFDTAEGKLIAAGGVAARYVRLYSRGSTANAQNHYTEVEVYGKPVK